MSARPHGTAKTSARRPIPAGIAKIQSYERPPASEPAAAFLGVHSLQGTEVLHLGDHRLSHPSLSRLTDTLPRRAQHPPDTRPESPLRDIDDTPTAPRLQSVSYPSEDAALVILEPLPHDLREVADSIDRDHSHPFASLSQPLGLTLPLPSEGGLPTDLAAQLAAVRIARQALEITLIAHRVSENVLENPARPETELDSIPLLLQRLPELHASITHLYNILRR